MAWHTEIDDPIEVAVAEATAPTSTAPSESLRPVARPVDVGNDTVALTGNVYRQGDRDAGPNGDIRAAQTALGRLGTDVGEVDGVYGRNTANAVQDGQEMLGLPRTGVLDQDTQDRFNNLTDDEIAFFTSESEEIDGEAQEAAPVEVDAPATATAGSFFLDIGVHGESDHGGVPEVTNDAREANLPLSQRTRDIAFGHKITTDEMASGLIHGVRFRNEDGTFRELTEEDKTTILMADMNYHADRARVSGWDTKLENIGSSWEALEEPYRNALTSLAYNVGGDKAGRTWTNVLTAARDQNVQSFALGLRRKDAGRNTAGMDNRVAKELYYSGLISSLSEVADQLPLANAAQAGIPE